MYYIQAGYVGYLVLTYSIAHLDLYFIEICLINNYNFTGKNILILISIKFNATTSMILLVLEQRKRKI